MGLIMVDIGDAKGLGFTVYTTIDDWLATANA